MELWEAGRCFFAADAWGWIGATKRSGEADQGSFRIDAIVARKLEAGLLPPAEDFLGKEFRMPVVPWKGPPPFSGKTIVFFGGKRPVKKEAGSAPSSDESEGKKDDEATDADK